MQGHRPSVARFLAGTVSLAVLSAAATLLAWAVVYPVLRGWTPTAVVSGSMAPAIDVGDILVAGPVDPERLQPGAVVVFDRPGGGGFVAHRIVGRTGDGELTTRGDANAEADSARIDPADVRGIGRLVVPLVGLPQAWAREGEWLPLAGLGLVLVWAMWTCRWGILDEFDPWRDGEVDQVVPTSSWGAAGGVGVAVSCVVIVAGLVHGGTVSQATFVDPADSPTNSITAASTFP